MRYAATRTASPVRTGWLIPLYLIVGGIVAATHHYWSHLHTLRGWGSALIGTVLWPLIFAGVNLHIH